MTRQSPTGWTTTTVGEACSIRNDLRLPISREERATMEGPYPYYGPTGRLDSIADFRLDGTFALIGEDGDHFLDVEKKPQTILVTGKFNVNNHAHVIESTDLCTAEWFYNYFRHRSLKPFLTRQGAGRYKLNKAALQEIPILLPPLEDQAAINALFREWDTAIQKTEQLIAAKERSCKALMQQVFRTGTYPKRYLSEFTHRVTRKNIEGDGHPLTISGAEGLVSQSRYFGKRIAAEKAEHYTLLNRGEFAYNKSYSAGYPLGAIKRLDTQDKGIVSTLYLCFSLADGDSINSDYFAYFCDAGGFNHQIYQVAQEGARNHGLLNVTADDFFSMEMPVPPRAVQERVVKVVRTAKHELCLLRKQLAALRTQKRGLMQKLLTGQWRLPATDEGSV